jgi:hypothetical protein
VTRLTYQEGYRYVLRQPYQFELPKAFPQDIHHIGKFLMIRGNRVTLEIGYASDGPSGPPYWITHLPGVGWLYQKSMLKCFLRGAFEHDALYQLMREGILDKGLRKYADKALVETTRQDGMSRFRCAWVYRAVRLGGGKAMEVGREIKHAP